MDNQLDNGKLNIFNKSAFTVVGNPTITDDGIASGFSGANYLVYPNFDTSKPWNIRFNFNCNRYDIIQGLIRLNKEKNVCVMVRPSGEIFFRNRFIDPIIDLKSKPKFIQLNTDYICDIGWTGTMYYLKINNNLISSKDSNEVTILNETYLGVGQVQYYSSTSSIDLKQFSITVDGKEVFSGTKTINTNLKQYLPIVYEGIVESETQQDSLSIEIDKMNNTYEQALMDQFVQFASLKVLPYYENIFNIVANPETESVQFRRERVLARMKMLTPPYTYYYLRTMLDGFFGKDKYTLDIDNNNFTISLESSASDSLWYHEIQVSITAVKPCNMIFINIPKVFTKLTTNEKIYHTSSLLNYKLDGTWLLGLRPFQTTKEEQLDKMANVHSIQQKFIDKTIEDWKTFFAKSVINDSYNVTQLNISSEDSNLIITYSILGTAVNTISNIKLMGTDNSTLINANVFIPVDDYVTIKHIINLQEVLNG